jgi:hypothetical protein
MRILKLPQPLAQEPVGTGASVMSAWKARIMEWWCRILNLLGIPGAIRDAAIDDQLTGQIIRVRVGVLFTRISVNGRDYYFRRISGRFDGTGAGCA